MPPLNKTSKMLTRMIRLVAFLAVALSLWAVPARAALTVTLVNGYNLVVDSNVTSPSTYAPRSAYIGAKICNTGTTTLHNVFVYVGDSANNTPGIYPVVDSDTESAAWKTAHPQLADTGDYSLTHVASAADATRYIGDLAPGECRMEYWLITYPQCVNIPDGSGGYISQNPPCDGSITGSVKPDDDLTLSYDIWATSSDIAGATDQAGTLTMRNEISASANKIWPNNTSHVPTDYLNAIQSVLGWGTIGPDGQPLSDTNPVYPGQRVITTQGIWYDLGNVNQGFDNNGDLIPDQNAWLQPVGDPSSFDPDCFRLIKTYGIVVVSLKTGGTKLIPFVNQLYFSNLPDNTGVVGLVYYQFIATGQACSASMTPYQESASGYDNEKFSADYGLTLGMDSGSYGSSLVLNKTDGVTSTSPGDTLTYTISAPNNTGVNLGAPDVGMPLVFQEHIPAGTSYVAGSAAAGLSAPSGTGTYTEGNTDSDGNLVNCTINYTISSSTYSILYSTDDGKSWSAAEPTPAGSVTDIQWWLNTILSLDGGYNGVACIPPDGTYDNGTLTTSLPAGKTASVSLQLTVGADAGPELCNTAELTFGGGGSGTTASDCDMVAGNNSISGTVFKDNGGTTGIFANGIQDGDEAGVGDGTHGVDVSLYYDANGDGKVDSGDIQHGNTITADPTTGAYTFSNLPDGQYLVVVKKYDGATDDGIINAVNDFPATAGWGNTTPNPNLPLTTNEGIVKMAEDATTVTLAVNIDLNHSNSSGDTVSNVDFGFAPPLTVAKTVDGGATSVVEGNTVTYDIVVSNNLPTVGHQGPTGCEYTAWATTGQTGSQSQKAFANPGNAWDGPNRTVASAPVSNGSLNWINGTDFNIPSQGGSVQITKVEALFMGYFDLPLDNDYLALSVTNAAGTQSQSGTIPTSFIASYIGQPATLDPNSAIAWNISTLKPGGTGSVSDWAWSDFRDLQLEINPSKNQSGDDKTFYLDAIGLRVTANCNCTASDSTTLNPVPLEDTYDATRFDFVSSNPPPTAVDTSTGVIQWDDVGPVLPGNPVTVTVTLRARQISADVTGDCATSTACNSVTTDYDSKDVEFADGRVTNDAAAQVSINMIKGGEIHGIVWKDVNSNWDPTDATAAPMPNVKVTLYACMSSSGLETSTQSNKSCGDLGDTWQIVKITTTDANGNYSFIGLNAGYYIVEVGDTDNAPAGGNISPYGSTEVAEPNDAPGNLSSGSAPGPNTTNLNNTWGNPTAYLSTMNLMDSPSSPEIITGVNFEYTMPYASVYGNIWYDINGNAAQEPGETGLSGFTVQIYSDPNADGDPADGILQATTITDTGGNYSFGNLATGSYVIVVTPPAVPNNVWSETDESTGGTGSLNNQIPVTLTAGNLFGSYNFGYTKASVSSIGDTVYYDFNGNGTQDPGESGIPGVNVYLYQDMARNGVIDSGIDPLVGTAVTDANGKYTFTNLAARSYVVKVGTSDSSFPTGVTATGDPDVNQASIAGTVSMDLNRDGTINGDAGLPGVTVLLYEDTNGNGVYDAGIDKACAAAATDLNGKYLFSRLNTGVYWVAVDAATLPDTGLVGSGTNPLDTPISVTSRTANTTYPAPYAGFASGNGYAMGGRIWSDANDDGVQESGEVGISNVKVTVTDSTGQQYTTTTDASGFWMVSGLPNDTYTVTVDNTTLPTGFSQTNGTGNTATQTISGADITGVDFGYAYLPIASAPVSTVSGRLFSDANGNGVCDAGEAMSGNTLNLYNNTGELVATTTAATDGTYSFTGVFIGTYSVEAIDKSGDRYTTKFLSPGTAYTGLNIIYNPSIQTAPDSESAVAVDGVHANRIQDFGYQRFVGSIGDTVYFDVNENGTQDTGEPGISGVTVNLYLWNDTNGDGVVDSNELTLVQTQVTTADNPATPADESGKYLFTNLSSPPAGQYYLVRVDTSTLPGTNPVLIGDPDADGVPCNSSQACSNCCDSQEVVKGFTDGTNYLGADFGYYITGSGNATIGDTVWIDANGNGVQDAGEVGISNITVNLTGTTTGGSTISTSATTNTDGFYTFTGLADGTYQVRVPGGDLPAGLSSTYLPDGTPSSTGVVTVTITNGVVTAINGNSCTSCNLNVDFGYRYAGIYSLSGTIGVDDPSKNGYLGATPTTYSGVDTAAGEIALSGISVSVYQWNDNDGDDMAWDPATGALDANDTFVYLGSTSTDANGDYSFANLPSTAPNNKVIVVFGVSASSNLALTTTQSNTSVAGATSNQIYNGTDIYQGNTVTDEVRQALTLNGNTQGLDFAFDATLGGKIAYDYGDLPDSAFIDPVTSQPYGFATLLGEDGARALVTTSSTGEITSIHLGATVTTEMDGKPSANATGDSGDDGVTLFSNNWTTGPNGASVVVNASASGWLAGWVDFNGNGNFNDDTEQIISQPVSAGNNTISFFVPQSALGRTSFFARFRIYPAQPLLVSSSGEALDSTFQPTPGEVEDYEWTTVSVQPTYVSIASFTAHASNGATVLVWETSSEVRTAGFDLLRLDTGSGKYMKVNRKVVPAVMSPRGGVYQCIDPEAVPGKTYTYKLSEREISGRHRTYGPYTVNTTGTGSLPSRTNAKILFQTGQDRYAHPLKKNISTREAAAEFSSQLPRSTRRIAVKVSTGRETAVKAGALARSRRALSAEDTASVSVDTPDTKMKIYTKDPGLYQISAADIAGGFGVSSEQAQEWISGKRIRLTNIGKSVSYLPFGDNTGLYFYAGKYDTIYTDYNIYWLSVASAVIKGDINGDGKVNQADAAICLDVLTGKPDANIRENYATSGADVNGNGKIDMVELSYIMNQIRNHDTSGPDIMQSISGGHPEPVAVGSFETTKHFGQNIYDRPSLFNYPEADYWFWNYVIPGDDTFGAPQFSVEVDNPASGAYSDILKVNLQGVNDAPNHVQVLLNSTLLGDMQWNGATPFSKEFPVDQNLLNEGTNTITIKGIAVPDAYSAIAVNDFDLIYHRLYKAVNDCLAFSAEGSDAITVAGFSGPDIGLFDLSDPEHPKIVTDTTIDQSAGNYRITFNPDGDQTDYLAVLREKAKTPDAMSMKTHSDLKDSSNKADYLIITCDDLKTAAQALANYRQGQGLSTKIVSITDIFDAFNHGIYDPHAIHDFIAYAAANWSSPLKYVVLVGDGNYDYKNYLQTGENLVPVLMTGTPDGLFSSDNLYVDVNNDGMPDIPIGRIPVDNATELAQVIGKIIKYESTGMAANKQVVLVADKPNEAGDFPADSDAVAQLVPSPGYTLDKVYLPDLTKAQARQDLIDDINAGAYLVNYIGHGGYDVLSQPPGSILSTSDLTSLSNSGQYPLFVALTCLVGGFSTPGADSLSKKMVLLENSGSIAAWSPTGLSQDDQAVLINKDLFTAIFNENTPELGNAVLKALQRYRADNPHYLPYMIDIYNLLGDPALKIR